MHRLIQLATERRVTIVMLMVAIILFGMVSLSRLKLRGNFPRGQRPDAGHQICWVKPRLVKEKELLPIETKCRDM